MKHRKYSPRTASIGILEQEKTAEAGDASKPEAGGGELEEYFGEISDTISELYRLSTTIQNPARRDRLERCSSINVSQYEHWDFQHISNKFPNAEQYLWQRLGKANTKRRQILKYHELYHKTLSVPDDNIQPTISPAPTFTEEKGQSEGHVQHDQVESPEFQEHPNSADLTDTTSKYPITISTSLAKDQRPIDAQSDTDISQTSCAMSSSGTAHTLRVPLPLGWYCAPTGSHFECPHCYLIVAAETEQRWRYVKVLSALPFQS